MLSCPEAHLSKLREIIIVHKQEYERQPSRPEYVQIQILFFLEREEEGLKSLKPGEKETELDTDTDVMIGYGYRHMDIHTHIHERGFPDGSNGRQFCLHCRESQVLFGLGRSPGKENGYYPIFRLKNPMDRVTLTGYCP